MTNATTSVHSSAGASGDDNAENIITASTSTANVIATAVVLPSVVIALASVVLAISTATTTGVSSSTHYTERILGQVGLLICASLVTVSQSTLLFRWREDTAHVADAAPQHHQDALNILSVSLYCTMLLNLVCTALSQAIGSVQHGSNSGGSRTSQSRSRWYYRCMNESNMHSISIAPIGPVAYSTILVLDDTLQLREHHNMWRMLVMSYIVALLVIIIVRRMIKFRRNRRDVLVGIPVVGGSCYGNGTINGSSATTAAQHLPPPRPDTWYDWSPDEVAEWVSSLPHNRNYASASSRVSMSGSLSNYAAMLQEEHVDGAALASITVDALQSFGMPYGIASIVRRNIDEELIGRYGTGNIRLHGTTGVLPPSEGFVDAEQWLDQIQSSSAQKQYADRETGTLDPDMSEKAQEMFSERFGMILPEFKTQSSSNHDAHDDGMRRLEVVDEERSNDVAHSSSASPASPLNEALLVSMPPDVREVATRRPDLVRTLLLNRRGTDDNTHVDTDHDVEMSPLMQTAPTSVAAQQAPTLLTQVQRAMIAKPSYAERYTGAQAAAEISGVEGAAAVDDDQAAEETTSTWDNDEGSDTVGLLRRRPYR